MKYEWIDWQAETDFDNPDDREGVFFLTILDPDGEELAIIIHRESKDFPLNGKHAKEKRRKAQDMVDALNAHQWA